MAVLISCVALVQTGPGVQLGAASRFSSQWPSPPMQVQAGLGGCWHLCVAGHLVWRSLRIQKPLPPALGPASASWWIHRDLVSHSIRAVPILLLYFNYFDFLKSLVRRRTNSHIYIKEISFISDPLGTKIMSWVAVFYLMNAKYVYQWKTGQSFFKSMALRPPKLSKKTSVHAVQGRLVLNLQWCLLDEWCCHLAPSTVAGVTPCSFFLSPVWDVWA